MEKAYLAVLGPQHVKNKCEEVVLEKVCEDEQETYLRIHWGLLLMHGIEVDEEYCKWSYGHLEEESICMNKQEDCDSGPMDFTVDSELLSYITDVQKNKTLNSIKEELLSCEPDWQCSYPDKEAPGLGLTSSSYCPLRQHSVHVKLESDMKGKVKAIDSSPSGEALQANGSFFFSPLAQTSPQCISQQTVDDKNMKNLTSGSENGIPASLQNDSQPVMKLHTVDVITTQIRNTDLTRVYQTPREWIKSKYKSKDGNLCQTQQEPYECSESGKSFHLMGHLQDHRRIHSGEKAYYCQEFGKGFTTIGNLLKHVNIHIGKKAYYYSECGKLFSQKSALQAHPRTHTGEKPYCSECGKRFQRMGYLQEHRRIHTGKKPYCCCSECGKGFTCTSNHQDLRRIHTGEKPYCCPDCGKRFTQLRGLKTHKRIHTGEKPYCYSECGTEFMWSSCLQVHRRIHTGEKPYCCSDCGKRFTQLCNLKSHRGIHIREKPFPVQNVETDLPILATFRNM